MAQQCGGFPVSESNWPNCEKKQLQRLGEHTILSGLSHQDTTSLMRLWHPAQACVMHWTRHSRKQTNLVSKNSDGTRGGNLLFSKPRRGQVRGDTQDAHGGHRAKKLAPERHWEHVRMSAADFHPGADAVEGRADEDDLPDAPGVQEPEDGQDQGHVREEVDGGQPVDG